MYSIDMKTLGANIRKARERHHDHRSPPGLAALAADGALTESLGIKPAEWLRLASVKLPRTVTKEGDPQLLITLRTISVTGTTQS